MTKKARMTESEKKIVASVDREMQAPRLAESVRRAEENLAPHTVEKPVPHAA
jgi:hypothetical protein